MNKSLAIVLLLSCTIVHAQEKDTSDIQPATIGIYFTFNDFETAAAIRHTSLGAVLRDKKYGKLENMPQGLAVSYGKGLSKHWDFVGRLGGAFLTYPVPGTTLSANDALLMEGDASLKGKMFTDRRWFVPYVQFGVGISKYKGYWGTFIPIGVGIQISFFGEAFLHINSQYRVAVAETTAYHFVHSIGLVGNIGKRTKTE